MILFILTMPGGKINNSLPQAQKRLLTDESGFAKMNQIHRITFGEQYE